MPFFFLVFAGASLFVFSSTAHAASKVATDNCKTLYSKKTERAACAVGYDFSYDGKNATKECQSKYKSNKTKVNACINGGFSGAINQATTTGGSIRSNIKPLIKNLGPGVEKECGKGTSRAVRECRKAYLAAISGDSLPKSCKTKKCKDAYAAGKEKYNKSKATLPAGGSGSEVSLEAGGFKDTCGSGQNGSAQVQTKFNFGCRGEGNPIQDMAYAIIRFLSIGVALILVASIIYAGIEYSTTEGNPEQAKASKKRIQNAFIGLIFYLIIFALVQFLVPGGLFA